MKVVVSPPGITSPSSPSSCSGFRTSTVRAPRRCSICACSRKFPCTASTPIVNGSMGKWYRGAEALLRGERADDGAEEHVVGQLRHERQAADRAPATADRAEIERSDREAADGTPDHTIAGGQGTLERGRPEPRERQVHRYGRREPDGRGRRLADEQRPR